MDDASSRSIPNNPSGELTRKTDPPEPIRLLHILGELKPSGAEVMYHAAAAMWRSEGIHGEILSIGANAGVMAAVRRRYSFYFTPQAVGPRLLNFLGCDQSCLTDAG